MSASANKGVISPWGLLAGGPATGSRAGHTAAGMVMLVGRGTRGTRKEKKINQNEMVVRGSKKSSSWGPRIIRYDYGCWSEQFYSLAMSKSGRGTCLDEQWRLLLKPYCQAGGAPSGKMW
ncbi:hypothetical protein GLAREA_07326 [Glarea lozoyensis ATCC 20868]|uniref:Uncharacterized protein n=1 Tax=Glarea lozoyensis (strain ATCC 20868 / MF5171) TaxID=1116229 RepID=S3E103_GLAL2|nr:uncharacterized protein GLAREA_07326 [Glarea lozoyensis ATCC 20868]EPE32193.1 hypothetical protein GLAREA_07326 [Glarea lozoyensis ATCC 20868]